MRVTPVRAGPWVLLASLLAAPTPSAAGGEALVDSLSRVRAALVSPEAALRERGFGELEACLARDAAACGGALEALKEVLRLRSGAERARVARLLLKLPGDETAATWWSLLDPLKEDDDRVLGAAIEAVSDRASDPALARRLLDAARDPRLDGWRRALAVEALGGLDSPAAPLVLFNPRPGADWVEESCRALALGRRGRADCIAPLIGLLPHAEAPPRVHAWEMLVQLTHQDLPLERGAWAAWWESQHGRLPAVPAAPQAGPGVDPYRPPAAAHIPRYYGVPVRAKGTSCHVVFCLDMSASMKDHGIGPARRHLADTLREFTTHASFDVVAFNENVLPFAGRLQRAHPITKARAIRWLDAIVPKAYTNIYDAVETAFQYAGLGRTPSLTPERLDLVFLLSDGAPNRGRYHVADQVLAGIAALSDRKVPVHTIGAGETVLPLLHDIAAATGGTFQQALD